MYGSSGSEVFLGKGVLKICRKCTGEHTCRSAISIKLLCNFIEITLRHGYSPLHLLHIFRIPFLKNTSGWLLLTICKLSKITQIRLFLVSAVVLGSTWHNFSFFDSVNTGIPKYQWTLELAALELAVFFLNYQNNENDCCLGNDDIYTPRNW